MPRNLMALHFRGAGLPGRVGFIGLGNMGGHMATNLVKKGHSVVVFDLNKGMPASMSGCVAIRAWC